MKRLSTLILFLSSFPIFNHAQIYEEDIYEIVDSIDATVSKEDAQIINVFFAKDSFLNLVLRTKTEVPEAESFRNDFRRGFERKLDFGKILLEYTSGYYYDFINYYESVDNEVHVLFRLFDDESGGINYHDYILSPINDTLQIIDVYYFRSGERLSKTYNDLYKRVLRDYLNNEASSFFSKKEETESEKAFNTFARVKELYNKEEYQKAYDLYLSIPEKITNTKSFRLWKVTIAGELDGTSKYNAAVAEYEKAHPDDPSLYIIAMDRYFLEGNYEKAMRCVDKLDIAVGLDDFLNYFRGNIYYAQENYEKAIEKYEFIATEYPSFMMGWTNLIEVYHEIKQNSKLIETLTKLQSELEKPDIIEYMKTEYPDFCKTQEFKDWEKTKNK